MFTVSNTWFDTNLRIHHQVRLRQLFSELPPIFGCVCRKKSSTATCVFVLAHAGCCGSRQQARWFEWVTTRRVSLSRITQPYTNTVYHCLALTHSHSLPLSKPGPESSDTLRHLPYTQSVTSNTLHNHRAHTYTQTKPGLSVQQHWGLTAKQVQRRQDITAYKTLQHCRRSDRWCLWRREWRKFNVLL